MSAGGEAPTVVVGGGLAGLTAALDLAEAGRPVTLVERRRYAGGKTFSFSDPETGTELDNGQHITLRCCTAYQGLLDRLGLADAVAYQDALNVPVLDPGSGRIGAIAAAEWIPAPLHLTSSLLEYPHLSPLDKARLGLAVFPMWRMGFRGRRLADNESFGEWLRAHGQTQRVIERFWDLIVLPTCNDVADAVSARQAIMVFQVGLLQDAHAADVGLLRVPLSRVADAALNRLRDLGGEVLLGRAVERLDHDGDLATGVRFRDGPPLPASRVVLALPPNRARDVLPEAWRRRAPFSAFGQFEYAPIVNVHLRWDRPVLRRDFLAVLDPLVQYLFNRSRIHGWEGRAEWLSCSLSGAHDVAAWEQDRIRDEVIAAVRRALPAAREAQVLSARVVKEMEATFRPRPGVHALRPLPRTPIANLTLAGAWTATEWPATMESAVRSGQAAAEAILGPAPR